MFVWSAHKDIKSLMHDIWWKKIKFMKEDHQVWGNYIYLLITGSSGEKKIFKSENNENSIHSSFDLHFWHKKTFNVRNARNIYMYIHNVERKVFECLKDFYRKSNAEIFFKNPKDVEVFLRVLPMKTSFSNLGC